MANWSSSISTVMPAALIALIPVCYANSPEEKSISHCR
ncbi:hypothetical protein AOR13_2975 [Alteromonas stellipolaris LMG 21856]|nr:hypothetical protein AOR13_2975 [Alteromonas stellipolaris LMG 21856]